MAIRYDNQLKNEIYKAVRSFNAKISRLERKGVSAALLPDRISTQNIKQNYTNRRQLRSYLASLQDFTSKGQVFKSKGGVTGTTQLFQYNIKRANKATAALSKERRNLADIPTRYPMMKSENISLLESKMKYLKRDIYNMDIRQINIFKRNIESTFNRNKQNSVFHKNFNTMMLANGYRAGLSESFLNRLANKMDRIAPEKLLELYRTIPSFSSIVEKYQAAKNDISFEEQEIQNMYEAVEAELDDILESELSDSEKLELIKDNARYTQAEIEISKVLQNKRLSPNTAMKRINAIKKKYEK